MTDNNSPYTKLGDQRSDDMKTLDAYRAALTERDARIAELEAENNAVLIANGMLVKRDAAFSATIAEQRATIERLQTELEITRQEKDERTNTIARQQKALKKYSDTLWEIRALGSASADVFRMADAALAEFEPFRAALPDTKGGE